MQLLTQEILFREDEIVTNSRLNAISILYLVLVHRNR